jgi:pyochelin biosynthetic protein PchC
MYADSDQISSQWFRAIRRQASPETRVICFPHAGGSASFFNDWAGLLPPGAELFAVRYPGREDRILDPLADTMADIADPVARACSELGGTPLVFFGHSMGAAVAYEVAQRLGALIDSGLAGLFVSGYPGPGYDESRRDPATLSDDELVADMNVLGGTNPAVLDNPDLRQLFLPAVRADYRIIAGHRITVRRVIEAPVVAYYGDRDEDIDERSVSAWSTVTNSTFTAQSFNGGHFYLIEHAKDLITDLFSHLTRTVT